jgi:hypothetical protein
MGTSITLFIEKLTDSGWVPAQKVVPKEDLDGVSYVIADEDKLRINSNYVLFSLPPAAASRMTLPSSSANGGRTAWTAAWSIRPRITSSRS